jgi:hypothetical protein
MGKFFPWLILIPWMVLDGLESKLGHDWIRTSDLFRVKASISTTFNNLQVAGDCQGTWKHVEDEYLAGYFTGENVGGDRPIPEASARDSLQARLRFSSC